MGDVLIEQQGYDMADSVSGILSGMSGNNNNNNNDYNHDLCDVVLISGDGQRVKAHKLILAAKSPMFRNIFCNDDVKLNGIWMRNCEVNILRYVL